MGEGAKVLTSARNPRIVEAAKLHDGRRRRQLGQTLVEGPHLVADVVAHGAVVREIFHLVDDQAVPELAQRAGAPATAVSHSVLRRLAGTDHPRGPVAVVDVPSPDEQVAVDTVVLWEVAEPGNAGAIVRTAAGLGYAVATVPGTTDLWAPKTIRAAAATQFGTRIAILGGDSLDLLRRTGLHTVATVATGGIEPAEMGHDGPVAIIVGNEAHGLPAGVAARADSRVTIPLQGGVESLNVAVAAALVMYALRRS